ncbi:transcriptional regulator with XRE-family HTH domain [Bradyrhizobium diazoefficiens]
MAKLTTRDDTTPLGQRMTERMKLLGLDDQDVTDKSGLSYDTVRSIRRLPKNPSTETATKIATVLGVSTDWLLHGTDPGDMGANGDPPPAAARIQGLKRKLAEAYAELSGDPVERVNVTITIT